MIEKPKAKMRLAKAEAKKSYLKLGMYGGPGTGKTLTSHMVAELLGDLDKKQVAVVDTEHGADFYYKGIKEYEEAGIPPRAIHPEAFKFTRETEHAREIMWVKDFLTNIDTEIYGVVILDSASHIWDSAKELYDGKMTKAGKPPIYAYDEIKKPWKQMLDAGLNGAYHLIICGREQNVWNTEGGDWTKEGTRMRAERDAGHEPDITCRMYQERKPGAEQNEFDIKMYVEKDRTGVLQGRSFKNPTADLFMPIYKLLGGGHEQIADAAETAERDLERLDREKSEKASERERLRVIVRDKLIEGRSVDDLKTAWSLTQGKKIFLGDAWDELEKLRDTRYNEIVQLGAKQVAS